MRAKLSADHVNELTCLSKWMSDQSLSDSNDTVAVVKRAKKNEIFTTLSLNLELISGEESSGDESDQDSDVQQ